MSCLIAPFGCRASGGGWRRAEKGLHPIARSETCSSEEAEVELVGGSARIDQSLAVAHRDEKF